MRTQTILVLKALIAAMIALLAVCQFGVIPATASGMARAYPEFAWLAVPGIILGALFLLCVEVVLVCVWRLLDLVAADRTFTDRAFVWVDVVLGAVALATVTLAVALGLLSSAHAASPGIAIVCLLGVVVGAGLSLLIVVLRGLLRKASQLEADLSEVV
jgi:hypothetical protein